MNMIEYTKDWAYTPQVGESTPIIIGFTWEDWNRLERLSNRKDDWIVKLYDTIFKKAGLPPVKKLKEMGFGPHVTGVIASKPAAERIHKIGQEKYGERNWPWIHLDLSPSEHLEPHDPPLDENQFMIKVDCLGVHTWPKEVINAVEV